MLLEDLDVAQEREERRADSKSTIAAGAGSRGQPRRSPPSPKRTRGCIDHDDVIPTRTLDGLGPAEKTAFRILAHAQREVAAVQLQIRGDEVETASRF
jgi:hypothetical protein